MKIQYSYLKNFLNTNLSQKKLSDVFTQVGFECEIEGDLLEFDITPNRGDALSLEVWKENSMHINQKNLAKKLTLHH
jgi:phenylalanyl-tRNA synthetase beta subunit